MMIKKLISGIFNKIPSFYLIMITFSLLAMMIIVPSIIPIVEGVYIVSSKWGTHGTADGQFNLPGRIAVDSSGNVYVSDHNNHRIQKFTSTGTFITKWGSEGSGDGQFKFPSGVAVDSSGNVYVSDSLNNRIQKFQLTNPCPVSTTQIAFGVCFVTKWGSEGSGDGQFDIPGDIDVDVSGNVYVCDVHNNRIQKFSSSGNFIRTWGALGSGQGEFHFPLGIALDTSGNVYVSDNLNSRIQKFGSTGTFIREWGTFGSGDGQFNNPLGIDVHSSDIVFLSERVFVVDEGNNRIQVFLWKPDVHPTVSGALENYTSTSSDTSTRTNDNATSKFNLFETR